MEHYRVLGISLHATRAEVRRAYRQQVQRWHPDRHQGSAESHRRFLAIQAAFAVLSNDRARADYDEKNLAPPTPNPTPVAPSSGFPGGRLGGRRGDDIHITAAVPLAKAIAGTVMAVEARVGQTCPACLGSGCSRCRGGGQILVTRSWWVTIPSYALEGERFCFAGGGHMGPMFREPGDAWIEVQWTKRRGWRWSSDRQRLERNFFVSEDTLKHGGHASVRAPSGITGSVFIPAGTPPNTWLRVAGMGWPVGGGRQEAWLLLRISTPFSKFTGVLERFW